MNSRGRCCIVGVERWQHLLIKIHIHPSLFLRGQNGCMRKKEWEREGERQGERQGRTATIDTTFLYTTSELTSSFFDGSLLQKHNYVFTREFTSTDCREASAVYGGKST